MKGKNKHGGKLKLFNFHYVYVNTQVETTKL